MTPIKRPFYTFVLAAALAAPACSGDTSSGGSNPTSPETPDGGPANPSEGSEIPGDTEGPEGGPPPEGTEGNEGTEGPEGGPPLEGTDGTEGVEGLEGTEGTEGAEGIEGPEGEAPGPITYPVSCRVTGATEPPPLLKTTQVAAQFSIPKPVDMAFAPDCTGRVFVVTQPGVIYVLPSLDGTAEPTPWLDISDRVDDGPNEGGLLSMAFHPGYCANGRVFVNYTRTVGGQFQTAVSEFVTADPAAGQPDKTSEIVRLVIGQPYGNHNGGQIAFGPDGMLYIGMGDGGSGGDPQNRAQDLGNLLGKILRLDTDNIPAGKTYGIPPGNPFVTTPGAQPEIWAYGLRNPWRFSFDKTEGTLWAADVGQNEWEEVNRIERGGNYGWRLKEGAHCYDPAQNCERHGLIDPVTEYPHAEGKSVTGGYVYRGPAIPALAGAYVFGDYVSGLVWGVRPGENGAWERTLLAGTGLLIAAFGRDPKGELYILDHRGAIHRLDAQAPGAPGTPGWPETLSATGCFADVQARRFVDGVLAYEVNTPLWSDGAGKERGLALPDGGLIGFTPTGPWLLPDGAIAIKTFTLAGKPLETRFLVRRGNAWRGATYRWNASGTDAVLLTGSMTEPVGGQTWYYPSRQDCQACHTQAAGQILGIQTRQWNREHEIFPGEGPENQIAALDQRGYFDGPIGDPWLAERWPTPDDTAAPAETRARAYLHANCAHCHQPGGAALATFDLRYDTPLAAAGICGAAPQHGDLGVPGALILAPGDAAQSTLWLRMTSLEPAERMPALASSVVDPAGSLAVQAYIDGLQSCP